MSTPVMIGQSRAFQKAKEHAKKAAQQDAPVCLLGESGTGKELFARYIHSESRRASKTFEPLNCGAISRDLVGSELFGHERGAFTGAIKERKGVFERADNGVVFLDEIGTLPIESQPHFLRVLEEQSVTRVGGETKVRLDFRLISATNVDLKSQVESGHFREDLFYRVAVNCVHIPPLRERGEDIPLLANHYRERQGKEPLLDTVWVPLNGYEWPGNVRELRGFVEHLNCQYAEVTLDADFVADVLKRFVDRMPKRERVPATEGSGMCISEPLNDYMMGLGIDRGEFGTAVCSIAHYLLGLDSDKRRAFLGERCAISEDGFVAPLLADAVSLTCLVIAYREEQKPMDVAAGEFALTRMRRKSASELASVERAVYQRLKDVSL